MDEHIITGSISTKGECVSGTIKKKKLRMRILSAAVAAAIVLTGATLFSQVGYAVSVDGQKVGSGRNIEEIEEAVSNVEERVSDIIGEEYVLSEVTYEKSIGSIDSEEELEKALMASVECVTEMYVLKIDGNVVAGAENEETISEAVNMLMEKYAPANENMSYVEDMEITREYAAEELIMDTEEILSVIDPENGGDNCATVVSVVSEKTTEPLKYTVEYKDDDEMY